MVLRTMPSRSTPTNQNSGVGVPDPCGMVEKTGAKVPRTFDLLLEPIRYFPYGPYSEYCRATMEPFML